MPTRNPSSSDLCRNLLRLTINVRICNFIKRQAFFVLNYCFKLGSVFVLENKVHFVKNIYSHAGVRTPTVLADTSPYL